MPTTPFHERFDAEYSYMLDSAVELGEITPLEASVFYADTPAARALAAILDTPQTWSKHFLRNTARDYLDNLPKKERLVWALRSHEGMAFALKMLTERIEFVVQKKVQTDLGLEKPTAIKWMDELQDAQDFGPKLFMTVHDITPDNVSAFIEPLYAETKAVLSEDLDLIVEAVQWLAETGAQAEARQIATKLFAVPGANVALGRLPTFQQVSKLVKLKKVRNQARGAIKKAVALFTSFGMEESVQMLISGETVTLSHPDSAFKLEVAPLQSNWLEKKTVTPGVHVPFQLSLLTKEGIFLSRLCVLFDQTPVLDQLFALTAFVQTGNERELLEKANWFGIEDAAKVRSILEDKAPALLKKVPAAKVSNPSGILKIPVFHSELDQQWAAYKAPVNQWLTSWFGPVAQSIVQLAASPVPRLA